MSCPRIKLSNSQTSRLDTAETGSSLSEFAQQFRREKAAVTDINLTLLDAAGITLTLVLNQTLQAKNRARRVLFKI